MRQRAAEHPCAQDGAARRRPNASAVQTGEDALTHAALCVPDAAIVGMDLVDSTGIDVCTRLRQWSSMAVIISSRETDEDRVVDAFRAGADDDIIKPLRPRELVARLQAHMSALVRNRGRLLTHDALMRCVPEPPERDSYAIEQYHMSVIRPPVSRAARASGNR